MGAIGQKVAAFCRVFDINVQAYARKAVVQCDDWVKMTDFDTLISTSDIVSVHIQAPKNICYSMFLGALDPIISIRLILLHIHIQFI
ncbi:NAD(P)-dependent oxidoreductase [Priestia sp. FSL H7-0729]